MLKKKLSSLVSIVALLLSVLVVPLDVLAVESNKIVSSNYRDYNSIIFNDHTVHTADIEGSVAIGGDVITHGGFTYAGSYGNAHNIIGQGSLHEGTPGLVVAGNVNYNSDSLVVVEGGNFIHTDSYQASNKFNMDPNFSMINWSKEQMDALFNSFKADIANEMSLYKSMMTDQTEETIYHKKEAWVSQFDFYESKESDSVLFVDMSAESHDINDIYLPNLDAYDHVIIYSSQPSLKFSRGSIVYKGFSIDTGKPNNDVLFDMASKLTWVLPNATDLRIEGYGLIGDVYAPNASVDTKGGSLNGSLYAENLISAGGFEVHNFRNKPLIPEKTTEPTEPSTTEPSTTEPSTTEPSTTEPSTTEPSTTEPSTTEPSTTEPSTTEPSTTEPSTTEPSTTKPSIEPLMGELRATKEVNSSIAKLGDILTYEITAENIIENSIISNVKISDNLPKGLQLIKNSVVVKVNGEEVNINKEQVVTVGNKVSVTFNEIKGGQNISISLQARVTSEAVGEIINIALVEGEDVDPVKPKEEIPVTPEPTEPSTTEPSTTESSKTELGVVGSSNPKTPNGKSNVSNQKFLPKTGEELTPRMLLIQGLITILGTFLLFYTKKRIEDNPLN